MGELRTAAIVNAQKRPIVAHSIIHKWGLFARVHIPTGEMVTALALARR
jgi:hypothetical protein